MKLIGVALSALFATGYAKGKRKNQANEANADICSPSTDARQCLRDGKVNGARSICRWSNDACVDACSLQASKMRCGVTTGCAWNNPDLECIRGELTCAMSDGWIRGCQANSNCQWEGTFEKCCDAADLVGSCPAVFGPVDCTTLGLRECRQRSARGECTFDLGSRRNDIPWSCSNVATTTGYPVTTTEDYATYYSYSYDTTEDASNDTADSVWSPMYLAGGTGPWEGRIEWVDQYGQTATVCDDYFGYNGMSGSVLSNNNGAEVVCRELGYSGGVFQTRSVYGAGSGFIGLDNVVCDGSEASIHDCNHNGWRNNNCANYEDAGVRCDEPVQTTAASRQTTAAPILSTAPSRQTTGESDWQQAQTTTQATVPTSPPTATPTSPPLQLGPQCQYAAFGQWGNWSGKPAWYAADGDDSNWSKFAHSQYTWEPLNISWALATPISRVGIVPRIPGNFFAYSGLSVSAGGVVCTLEDANSTSTAAVTANPYKPIFFSCSNNLVTAIKIWNDNDQYLTTTEVQMFNSFGRFEQHATFLTSC